ncbi:histone H4, partial [Histoplasma capsulatum G186AR]|uniref:Uncharacterized protein n=2 Tax=Ajellomyces capsulatus TaxID=5037 RepID=A0A8H7YV71_AJECA
MGLFVGFLIILFFHALSSLSCFIWAGWWSMYIYQWWFTPLLAVLPSSVIHCLSARCHPQASLS